MVPVFRAGDHATPRHTTPHHTTPHHTTPHHTTQDRIRDNLPSQWLSSASPRANIRAGGGSAAGAGLAAPSARRDDRVFAREQAAHMPRPDYLLSVALTALENEVAAKIDSALAGSRFADLIQHFRCGYRAESGFATSLVDERFILVQDTAGFR